MLNLRVLAWRLQGCEWSLISSCLTSQVLSCVVQVPPEIYSVLFSFRLVLAVIVIDKDNKSVHSNN